jgi:hypothetical protein
LIGIWLVGILGVPVNAWLKSCDVDSRDGRGTIEMTMLLEEAMRFEDYVLAWEYWNRRSTIRPTRPDGQPNRPLTAYTVMFKELV